MNEVGDLNRLLGNKSIMNKESTVLRESIFRFMYENGDVTIWIRVWVDTILNATERDVQEKYDSLYELIKGMCAEEEFSGPKISKRILEVSLVNAVEVYTEPDVGCVLYKDWP